MWHRFNRYSVIAYFTTLIILGVFFAFNLFIAVLINSYDNVLMENKEKEEAL